MSWRAALFACLAGCLVSLPALGMKALDDEQLEEVSGAGLGFFIDGFSYDQATATSKITGVKNSANQDVQVDITGAYIKGAGSSAARWTPRPTWARPCTPSPSGRSSTRPG